jgi:uridine phosphorylase
VASRFESIEHRVTHREFVTLTGLCRGLPMSVVGTGIGTGNVEIALAKISVSGVGTPCRHDLPDNQTAPQSWVPGRV